MGNRELFDATEWRTLQFTPLWTFHAVAGADQKVDKKEQMALSKELAEGILYNNELAKEVLMSLVSELDHVLLAYSADNRDVMRGFSDAADLLDQKVSSDMANGFKHSMLLLGTNIAEASGGGFFGRGDKVSDEERAALAIVAVALRTEL